MSIEKPKRCAYCGKRFSDTRVPTRDHVFVESLGGRAILPACHDCNSRIGSDIEGPLTKMACGRASLTERLGIPTWR
jgi:hypothetical protein